MKTMKIVFVLFSAVAAVMLGGCDAIPRGETSSRAAVFPLRVSANGRHLIDAAGRPFLLHGDAAWSLLLQLTKEEAEDYLENRRQKGVNSIIVNLIDIKYADGAPSNRAGDTPFTSPRDFATPNEAYFAHADAVLRKADEKGILVVLNPCYTGWGQPGTSRVDGWVEAILANGPTGCRNYGRFLGKRYGGFPNIIWQAGGDQAPKPGSALERNWLEMLLGIKEHAPSHLWTAHWERPSTARDQPAFAPYMTIDNIYSGGRTYIQALRAYNRPIPAPVFLNEAHYEGYGLTAYSKPEDEAPQMMRAQAYWTLLSGATGHHFGSHFVLPFGWTGMPAKYRTRSWREGMESQGSREMVFVKRLFESRAWHELVPDQDHSVVTKGCGTFGKDDRVPGGDYVTAARTSDGKLVMAYVPSTGTGTRTITVDMARLSNPARARWYNPTNGAFTPIPGSPFANRGEREFTTPGDNGTGTGDWTLVIETAASTARPAGGDSPPARADAPAGKATNGPLRIHPTNPRYFADASGQAVYLTGSHPWDNLQDMGATNPPPAFDFDGYLAFLAKHGHNFVRLWRFELTKDSVGPPNNPPRSFIAQHPWKRVGPENARDGLPRFDLTRWDDVHFERLRSRVQAAGARGVYVSIMLFEGWCLRTRPSQWANHPMNAANNLNGINGDPDADGLGLEVQMLKIPAITEVQRAYIRKVVDTVNDLDNVLYEISNESLYHPDILAWQLAMVRSVNEYQARKPRQHPVGMTNLVAGPQREKTASNDALFASTADWVSPGLTVYGPGDPYSVNPPATTGRKVEILDTDHTWNNPAMTRISQQRADHAWVWKSFLRGYNPIYMDPLDLTQPDGVLPYAKGNAYAIVLARPAMGHTRAYAERVNLAAMTPRNDLASTEYCLANPGNEYLVYLPDSGEVTVDLSAATGAMTVEWFNPRTAEKRAGERVGGGAKRQFQAPFPGDAVLHLSAK
ncbi:MAG: DUF4038 domain-containing protein [Verrucomicrobia bacterium]|nr:DUF4038 domain-containing protein [Verrucomicrobiota bacterium]